MESTTKILGHSVHKMLVAFPIGLLLASVAFDTLSMAMGFSTMAVAAYWMLSAGIVGGLLAAPFGLFDLLALPEGTRAKHIGTLHAWGNVLVLCLFIGSWMLRANDAAPVSPSAIAFSVAGALVMLVTAWLGGELVTRLGVGISVSGHLDASSSLKRASGTRLIDEAPPR